MGSDKPTNREDEQTIGTSGLDTRESGEPQRVYRKLEELKEGQTLGSYRLNRLLGKGGFGEVWEAETSDTGRKLAIKVLTQVPVLSSNIRDRFQQEGRLAASLNHPNCVYVFGAEEIDGYPAITMELMQGGTLQDLLNRDEKLSIAQAVDYTIQLIEGLEAAQQAGIIHRDIKPSNCFLGETGNIKIGDFGLSKTLESDTKLTVTGTFLGTPSYSSPEQVRGQELDFRTDLYSLAATLYAMLTGHAPFEGKHAAEVLARIAADPPLPLQEKREDVPPGLEKIILRALSKDPQKRPASYDAFRKALIPYSSVGLKISGLGKRFIAYLVDSMILFPFASLGGLWSWTSFGEFSLIGPILTFTYFLLFDKFLGRTPGKLLFGLKVVSSTGTPVTWRSVLLRTLFFTVLTSVLSSSKLVIPLGESSELSVNFGWIGIIATMRRRNSYAGLHEILSQTRVMTLPPSERIHVPDIRPSTVEKVSEVFGPYRAKSVIWRNPDEALFAGHDETLDRDVWIHTYKSEARALPVKDISQSRSGRLRWIQGSREPGKYWDVYEYPSGTGLYQWVLSHGKLSWPEVRTVLEGTTMELEAQIAQNTAAKKLSLSHLWIDRLGSSKILDFPLSDILESEVTTLQHWPGFLHQLVLFGLSGKVVPIDSLNEKMPEVPVPESSRDFIASLCQKKFESPKSVFVKLQNLIGRRAEVSRWRRFASLSIPFVPFLLLFFAMIFFLLFMPKWFLDMALATEHLNTLSQLSESGNPTDRDRAESIETVLAFSYSEYAKTSSHGEAYRLNFDNNEEEQLESILRKHPSVTKQQYVDAKEVAGLQTSVLAILNQQKPKDRPWHSYVFPVVSAISFFSFFSIPIAFALRRPMMFALLGISIQTQKGFRIGRIRASYRSLLSWLPILLFNPGVMKFFTVPGPAGNYFYFGLIFLTFVGMIYAVLNPNRGLPDRIAGTVLVPN